MLENLKKALAKMFGVDVSAIDETFCQDVIVGTRDIAQTEAVKTITSGHDTKLAEYVTQVEARDKTIAESQLKITELTAQAAHGEAYLKSLRDDAAGWYKKSAGDEPDKTILEMIEQASIKQAKSLGEKFKAEVDQKFPMKCTKCGEVGSVERASSVDDPPAGDAGDGGGDTSGTSINL